VISKYSSFLLLTVSLFAKNIEYAKHDLHTLTPPKDSFSVSLEYVLLNDTVDLLNLKSKELSGVKNLGSIGDIDGYNIGLRYAIRDDLMVSYNLTQTNLEYLSDTMKNLKHDIYLRYNLFQDNLSFFNSGLSVDVGYIRNSLNDFYLRDKNAINEMIKRVLPNENAKLLESDGITPFPNEPFPRAKGFYASFNNTITKLDENPYISMTKTYDDSFYTRFLTGFYSNNQITDFYIGYKYSSIKNTISTTKQIIDLAKNEGYNLHKVLDRNEGMAFFGFNYSYDSGSFIYEFNYEYDRFFRDADLGYINYNHIINANISYVLNKNTLLSLGGKIMYRQFNGEIPYLYNEYTQSTFDHKYGYARFGLIYRF
jgi:hypothetical protein